MTPQIAKIIGIAVIAVLLFLAGIFVGYSYCKSSYDANVIDQQAKDAETVMKHEDKKDEVKTKVDKAITETQKIVDPTGCLDTDNSDDYLNGLQRADSAAKSVFN